MGLNEVSINIMLFIRSSSRRAYYSGCCRLISSPRAQQKGGEMEWCAYQTCLRLAAVTLIYSELALPLLAEQSAVPTCPESLRSTTLGGTTL